MDAIVEAATHILERAGLDGYNSNAVAERAGVSIGSFYQYFPNKDALTATLSRRSRAAIINDLTRTTWQANATLRDVLCRLIDVAICHQLDAPNAARAIDDEERRLGIDELDPESHRLMTTLIASYLNAFDRRGRWDDETIADLIAVVQTLVDRASGRGDVDVVTLRNRIAGTLIGYLDAS